MTKHRVLAKKPTEKINLESHKYSINQKEKKRKRATKNKYEK